MSATSEILADLKNGKVIKTDIVTIMKYGVKNLPDVIYKLRCRRHNIESNEKLIKHRGKSKWVVDYRMVKS